MIRSTQRKISISITLVILSIITIVIFSYLQTKKAKTVASRIHYTQNILNQLSGVYGSVVEHAGVTRKYATNGDTKYIERIETAAEKALTTFEQLNSTIKNKPVLKIQADSLGKYIFKRIDFSRDIIRTAKDKGFAAASALYETGRDNNNMVLLFIQKMLNSELNMLEDDEQKNVAGIRQLSYFLVALLAFMFVLIVIIFQKFRIDNAAQKKISEQLKEFNTQLEEQVKIKTAGIQKSENQLEASEKNLRQVLSSANENFYVIDKNYVVTIINEVAQKNLLKAWNTPIVTGTNIYKHLPEESDEPVRKSFDRAFTGEKIEYELHLFVEDLPSWVMVNYTPVIDESGNITGVGVFTKDISERKKTEEEKEKIRYQLNESYEETRLLASHIENIREEEKIKIAREIHDELGQQITGLKMDVSWIAKRLNGDNKQLLQKTNDVLSLLDETVRSVRRIASELRPGMLDDLGLIATIDWQSKEFEKRSGIKIIFDHPVTEFMTPVNISTGLFRIFQESLTNAARHSEASEIVVTIDKTAAEVTLKISDNGKGFEVSAPGKKHSLGLLGMKERTLMMGGRCDIFSAPGRGTIVTVVVTLPANY